MALQTNFTIAANRISVDEGNSIEFTITSSPAAANVQLFWRTNSGTTLANDFADNANSGSTNTNSSGIATVTRTLINDYTNEGSENLVFEIATTGLFGDAVASVTVPVNDTSNIPIASISVSATTISEGDSVVFTVNTQGIPNGGILYWANIGTNIASDFVDNTNLGTVTINNNVGTITRTLKNDLSTDGQKTIIIELKTVNNESLGVSSSVLVNDTSRSPPATYNISASSQLVNEGDTVVFTITTTNVSDGSTLYWTTRGATAADFSDNKISGSTVINNNTASITRTLVSDLTTEGNETIILDLRTVSIGGLIVATSPTVTVTDSSLTPAPTYTVASDSASYDEGRGIRFTITTTNVPNNTVLFWDTQGTTTIDDFVDKTTSGSVTIQNNIGYVFRNIANDVTTEGVENLIFNLRTSSGGTIVASSVVVTINDTSKESTKFAVDCDRIALNEGETVTFTIKGAGSAGSTVYWFNYGTATGDDFTDGLNQGTLTLDSAGTATLIRTLVNDLSYLEKNESIRILVSSTDPMSSPVAQSKTVLVLDSSKLILPSWYNPTSTLIVSVTPISATVSEGTALSYNITTSNYPNGTVLYWNNIGTATADDFDNNQNFGTITVNNNSAVLTTSVRNDGVTESVESFVPQFRLLGINGPIVWAGSATSNAIQINDTSKSSGANPTYSISTKYNFITSNEGVTAVNYVGNINYYITTANVPNNTKLYWKNVGTTVGADFTTGVTEGVVTVVANAATFTLTLVQDKVTEGEETVIIELRTDSSTGPLVARSSVFKVIDNSTGTPQTTSGQQLAVVPIYDIRPTNPGLDPNLNSYREGTVIQLAVDTLNVDPGTILYWRNVGASTEADYYDNKTYGTLVISSANFTSTYDGSGIFSFHLISDNIYEVGETIVIELRTDSPTGTLVATWTQPIIETSTPPIPTYDITTNTTLINEGDSVTFTIVTTNVTDGTVLYWKNIGTTNAADFDDSTNSGTITINNGISTVTKTLRNDLITEGPETIVIELRSGSATGTLLKTSTTVTVLDTSQMPKTYNIVPNKTTINEGDSVTYNITTTGVLSGTILYWNNIGTTSALDFTNGATKGTIAINNNVASLTLSAIGDKTTEGNETIILELRTDSYTGVLVALAISVTVTDSSKTPPTYSISVLNRLVDEGGILRFIVTTTNVPLATVLYWSIVPFKGVTTVDGQDLTVSEIVLKDVDYSKPAISSKSNIIAGSDSYLESTYTGTCNVSLPIISDNLTEGYEGFRIALYDSSISTIPVALSDVVVINDTSQTPPSTYNISPNKTSVNEGGSITYTITTTNVPDGTTFRIDGLGSTANLKDFDPFDLIISIQNNSASFTIKVVEDLVTEGSESVTLRLCASDYTVLASADPVTINDTSTSPPTYSITANKSTINEGEFVTYTITTTNVDDGTILYLTNNGTTNDGDFYGDVPEREITIVNNSASLTLVLENDLATEGDQTIILRLRTNGYGGVVVASVTTLVKDTSISPASYFIVPDSTNVDENNSINFLITTAGVPDNTIAYWKNIGSTTGNDFVDGMNSGFVIINKNNSKITRTLVKDFKTEGKETIIISLRQGSVDGPILYTARTVTVNDTSLDPVYSLISNVSTVNEGGSVTFTVGTSLPDETILYWKIMGSMDNSDFEETIPTSGTDNVTSGSVVIRNGSATFTKTLKNDIKTEGDEYIIMDLRKDNVDGSSVLDDPVTVQVIDTSFSRAIYSVSIDATSPITEGSTIKLVFNTVNIPDATYNWEVGGTMTANDFTDDLSTGTVTIKNSVGRVLKTIKNDLITDGDKRLQVIMKSLSGNVLARSSTLLVVDTSKSAVPESYTIVPDKLAVKEGETVTFSITTTGVATGTQLIWTIDSSFGFSAADVVGSVSSGSVTIANNSAEVTIPILEDTVSDSGETFFLEIRKDILSAPVATSDLVTVLDNFKFSVNGKTTLNQSLSFGADVQSGIETTINVPVLGLSGSGIITATVELTQPSGCAAYWGTQSTNKSNSKSITVNAKSSATLKATIVPVLLNGASTINSGIFKITSGTQTYYLEWSTTAI